jgi:glycosyltransferase involved in cell wall biosynthesis
VFRRNSSQRPARILLIVENVSYSRDHRLRKQVSALIEAGFAVSVICRADEANPPSTASLTIHQYVAPRDARSRLGFVWEYGYSWVMAALLTVKAFLGEGFSAVQFSGSPDIYFTLGVPFKALGRRLIFDQRDLSPEVYAVRYGHSDGIVYRGLLTLERASYRTADHVLVVNQSLAEIAQTRGGLPANAVTVVGNGPVWSRVSRQRPRPELKQGRRYLCCWVGLMSPQDRLDHAIRAISHVIHDLHRTDCQFVFIGEGDARAAAEQLVRALGLAAWVTFTGWLGESEVFTYLATADLGLEPNLEPFVTPVKGLEYMSVGLAFVAYDLPETRKIAAGAAALAEPGDIDALGEHIDELLSDEPRRCQLGEVGRRRIAESLAWEHQQERYLDVYHTLVGRPASLRSREAARISDAEALVDD